MEGGAGGARGAGRLGTRLVRSVSIVGCVVCEGRRLKSVVGCFIQILLGRAYYVLRVVKSDPPVTLAPVVR